MICSGGVACRGWVGCFPWGFGNGAGCTKVCSRGGACRILVRGFIRGDN